MAASTKVGFIERINDKRVSWKKRFEIISSCLNQPDHYVPNKNQVCLDWLCNAVSNKNRVTLSADELVKVWRLLTHILSSSAHSVIVKTSLSQVLQNCVRDAVDNPVLPSNNSLLECLEAVFKHHSSIFTTTYEHMVQVCSSVMTLMCQKQTPDVTTRLASLVLEHYAKQQRLQANQKQVLHQTADCLLEPFLILCHQTPSGGLSKLAEDILLKTFFHKDHESLYADFLSSSTVDEAPSVAKQKALKHVYDKLTSLVNSEEGGPLVSEASVTFLPVLLDGCHKLMRPSIESGLTFKMFHLLYKMLRLETSSVKSGDRLKALHRMLSTLSSEDIYSPGLDNATGNSQLKFLQMVVAHLLKGDFRSCSHWYSIWTSLLHLNHMTFDGKMADVLQAVWFNTSQLSEECRGALIEFLCCLLDIYARLRQIPKFLDKLFVAVSQTSSSITIAKEVLKTFGSVCEQLPQLTTVDTWSKFMDQINIACENSGELSSKNLGFLVELFNEFLINIKIADYSVTESTATKVQSNMRFMQDRVLRPLIDRFIQSHGVKTGICCLQLMHTWGELALLLQYHTRSSAIGCPTKLSAAVGFEDLNFVHPYLGKELSFTLSQKATNGNQILQVLFMSLVIQKVRAMLLFLSKHSSSAFHTSMQNCLQFMFHKLDPSHSQAVWDSGAQSLSVQSANIAQWSHLLASLPLYATHLSSEQLETVSQFLINNYTLKESEGGVGCCTTRRICCDFLTSSVFLELSQLHSTLLRCVWRSILNRQCDTTPLKSPKMKKKRRNIDDLSLLIDSNLKAESIDALVVCSGVCKLPSGGEHVRDCLQIMKAIPLENIEILDGTRCLANSLLLMLACSHSSMSTSGSDICELCAEVCCLLLDGDCILPLFTTRGSDELLSRMIELGTEGMYIRMVVKKLLALALRDESSLTALDSCVKKVTSIEGKLSDDNKVVQFLPFVMNALVRLHVKTYITESMRSVSQAYLVATVNTVTSLTSQMHAKDVLCSNTACVVESFNVLLWYLCVTGSDKLADLCKTVEKVAKKVSIELERPATKFTVLAPCLRFLQITFEFKDKFSNLKTVKILCHNFWKRFAKMLGDTIQTSTTVPTAADSDVGTEGDSCEISKGQKSPQDLCRLTSDLLALVNAERLHRQTEGDESPVRCDQVEDVRAELNKTFVAFIASCEVEEFTEVVHNVISMLSSSHNGYKQVVCGCLLWRQLLKMALSEQFVRVISVNTPNVLISCQALMVHLFTKCQEQAVHDTVLGILDTLVIILTQHASSLPNQSVELCLQTLLLTPVSGLHTSVFTQVVQAYHSVLNEMLVHHTAATLSMVPSFLNCSKRLLSAVLSEGRQRPESLVMEDVENLVKCAHLVDRLFALIITYKLDFSKVAIYPIIDYVSEVQKVTLIPAVKKALLPAIYKLLDICDEHAIAQLHTILSAGVKEIFKSVYAEYTKYHRYKGRV